MVSALDRLPGRRGVHRLVLDELSDADTRSAKMHADKGYDYLRCRAHLERRGS